MTKRSDEQDELTDAKRRRRRKGGLRVPSDDVPRPKRASETQVPARDPEASRAAAAQVAYAFDGEGGHTEDVPAAGNGAQPARPVTAEPDAEATSPFDGVVDEGDEGDAPATEMTDSELAAIGAMDDDTDASVQFPIRPASDGVESSAPRPQLGVEETAELPRIDEMAVVEPAPVGAVVRTPMASEGSRTGPMAQLAAAGSTRAPTEPAVQDTSGDSVDIAFDDEDDEQARPVAAAPKGKARLADKARRASTMELSIADLEEVMEDDEPTEVAATPPEKPAELVRVEAAAEAASASSDDDQAPTLEPQNAADSGEMLTDDLIEEVSPASPKPRGDTTVELVGEDMEEVSPPGGAKPAARPTKKRAETAPPPPPKSKAAQAVKRPPPAPQKTEPAGRSQPVRRGKPWFDEVFDEDYLRTLPFLTPQATQGEAQFVMESLSVEPGGQILDVACGYGRHAMELAARGYHVVGLDSSLPLLLRGADEAQRRGLTINFVHGDMRELNFEGKFDGAYCLFSSFGYFDDETNKKTAQNIARALKPNARCVFEVLNRDYLLADLPARVWWEGDGCVVLEEVEFNYFSSRIVSNRSIVFDDGRQLEQEISMRCFSLHELGKLLHAAGFRVLEISGNMATRGRFFGAQSRDIVVVAEHRGDAKTTNTTNGA